MRKTWQGHCEPPARQVSLPGKAQPWFLVRNQYLCCTDSRKSSQFITHAKSCVLGGPGRGSDRWEAQTIRFQVQTQLLRGVI